MNTTKPSAGSRQLLTAGLVCLLLTPLGTMAADIVRMMAERSGALVGMVSRSEEHTSELQVTSLSRMPSSA